MTGSLSEFRHEVTIHVVGRPFLDHGWAWEAEVTVDGKDAGSGTGPTVSSALDVAMDILYGGTNDHLNGDFGALENIRRFTETQA